MTQTANIGSGTALHARHGWRQNLFHDEAPFWLTVANGRSIASTQDKSNETKGARTNRRCTSTDKSFLDHGHAAKSSLKNR